MKLHQLVIRILEHIIDLRRPVLGVLSSGDLHVQAYENISHWQEKTKVRRWNGILKLSGE
jgi:hypothetical protein